MKYLNLLFIKRVFLVLFLVSGLFLFIIFSGYKYFSFNKLYSAYVDISGYNSRHIILACIIFALIYIFAVFFSIPIKPFLKMLSGLLFGLFVGFVVCLLSSTMGAMLSFLFIKYNWGEVSKSSKFKVVSKFKMLVEKHPVIILLSARLLPIPFFVPNILAGILQVKNSVFFFTTLIGIVPVTFIYVWIGVHFKETVLQQSEMQFIDARFTVVLSFLVLLNFIAWYLVNRYVGKKEKINL